MATKPKFELSVDQQALQAVAKAIKAETDGKQLRKDLIAEIKSAVEPATQAVQGKLRSIPSRTSANPSPAMGSYLASRVKPSVRLAGRSTGIRVRIQKTPRLRGFAFAARRLNRKSWRHRVFGRDVWVEQTSPIPGFFDETLGADKAKYRKAVIDALEKMAQRIAERAH